MTVILTKRPSENSHDTTVAPTNRPSENSHDTTVILTNRPSENSHDTMVILTNRYENDISQIQITRLSVKKRTALIPISRHLDITNVNNQHPIPTNHQPENNPVDQRQGGITTVTTILICRQRDRAKRLGLMPHRSEVADSHVITAIVSAVKMQPMRK